MKKELYKNWAKVVAKAWADEKFKKRLLENPDQVLRENGIDLPKDRHVKIHANDSKLVHFTLPEKPEGDLSENELKNIAAGGEGPCSSKPTGACCIN